MAGAEGPRAVLVTGGSSGIGAATVRRFAAAGDRVWFTYRSGEQRARRTVAELTEQGADVAAFAFDQGEWPSHERLLDALPGPVDVLVNNAAVGSRTVQRHVPGTAREQEAAFLRVNSVGPLWLIQQVLPGMLERGRGTIVNIASVGGGVAVFPGFHVADGMSKAALAYLTRHLAAELVHTPVRVVALCPGAVDTTMFRESSLDELDAAARRALLARLPGGTLIDPAAIAELVWWLCTEAGGVLHGAVLDASGGLGTHPGLITGGSEHR